MASKIPLAYSVRWLYQRFHSIFHSTKNGVAQPEEVLNQNSPIGILGRTILGLALVELAHSLPAHGKPGLISAGYRINQNQQTASVLEPDESETVKPKPKDEEKEETQGLVSTWLQSLSKGVNQKLEVHPDDTALLHQIDRLCEEEDFETALEILNNTRGDTVEHLWRRGHLLYEIAKTMPNNAERKALIIQGQECLDRAIEIDEDNYQAHFWMSPIVHARAEMDGLVATANVAKQMEKHLAALVRIKPDDPIGHFSYGMWYYAIAEISWIQKLAASAIGAGLPNCTFEQALERFMKAEEIAPNHSILNTWMMGKSYLEIKDYENARFHLSKAVNMPAKKLPEINAREESIQLLKKIENFVKHA